MIRTSLKCLLLLAAVVAPLQGCGSAGAGSCTITSTMAAGYTACVNYSGSTWTTSAVQAVCTPSVGTYSSGACAAGSGGTCTVNAGQPTEIKYVYTVAAGGSTSGIMTACTALNGTYSP